MFSASSRAYQEMTSSPIIFVTGTDTDVGKTFISSLLVHSWSANYWKPVQTGIESDQGDTKTVLQFSGKSSWSPTLFPPRYELLKPLSPYKAMEFEPQVDIKLQDFQIPQNSDERPLIVEGAGGIYVPITKKLEITTDLIKHLIQSTKRPVKIVVVARSGLGTLNHTLLTWEYLRSVGLQDHLLGCVVNGPANSGNVEVMRDYGVTILAEVDQCDSSEMVTKALERIPKLETIL